MITKLKITLLVLLILWLPVWAATFPDMEWNKLQVDSTSTFTGNVTFTSPAVLKGDSFLIACAENGTVGLGKFCDAEGVTLGTTRGYPLHRAGSLTGAAAQCRVGPSVSGYVRMHIYVNGSILYTCDETLDAPAAGGAVTWGCPITRGSYTWAADSNVSVKFVPGGGLTAAVQNCTATVIGVFDN